MLLSYYFTGWVSAIFKGVNIFTKVVNYGSILTYFGASVYQAIRDCKDLEPDAELYSKKYEETFEDYKSLAREVQLLQQQGK